MAGNKGSGGNSNWRGGSTNRGGGQSGSTQQSGSDNRQGGQPTNTEREQTRGGYRGRGAPRGRSNNRGGTNPRGSSRGGQQGNQRAPQTPDYYESDPQPPSENITKLENKIVEGQKKPTAKSVSLGEGPDPAPRPEYGSRGETGAVWTNYFDLGSLQDIVLHQYIVKLDPEPQSLSKHRKRRIFSLLLREPDLADYPLATDYNDKLICSRSIEKFESDSSKVDVRYYETEEPQQMKNVYTLNISPHKRFHLSELIEDLSSPHDTYPDKGEAIQAMNTVMAAIPNTSSDVQAVGQSKHFELRPTNQAWNLGGGLVAMKGYFHSVRPSVGRLLLNLNVSTSTFFHPVPLDALIKELRNYHGEANLFPVLKKYLLKLKVTVNYLKDNDGKHVTKVKTIHGIAPATAGNLTFEKKDKDENVLSVATVKEHFETTHRVTVNSNEICVNVGVGKATHIPVSLCTVVPGQTARQKLLNNQTSNMIKFACKKPADNAREITQSGLPLMGISDSDQPDNLLNKFGILPEKELLSVEARFLKQPRLRYKNSPPLDIGTQGFWDITRRQALNFFIPKTTPFSWACLCLRRKGELTDPTPKEFMDELATIMKRYGSASPRNLWCEEIETGPSLENVKTDLDSRMQDFSGNILIIILNSQDAALYSLIKRCGDLQHGVKTLCIYPKIPRMGNTPKLDKSLGYLTNLCLKLNLKLGGTNQKLGDGFGGRSSTIYFGIDVTHPTGADSQKDAPSIAAVVANKDDDLGQWPASVRAQESRVEMVQNLKDMVQERLQAWKSQTTLPTNILVYRDGVSESQYKTVLTQELPEIQKGAKEYYKGFGRPAPKITLVVVGKRHHTRFYPLNGSNKVYQRSHNVIPGTVVDRKITMERGYDFFMVSHGGLQGTSRPAHYAVLHDEMNLGADKLQELKRGQTYHLCYIFGRSTTSVSIVPPAYYADIVCERARCYLYDTFNGIESDSNTNNNNDGQSSWNGRALHEKVADSMFYI